MPIYACLLIPSLALQCALAEEPGLPGRPVALADEDGLRVAEATIEARERGVQAGQPLREAVALCPALTVLEPHPMRVARSAEAMVEVLHAVSPLVEEAASGEVYADLLGTEGLYPRPELLEQALRAEAELRLPAALRPALGIAGARFTARVAAHAAGPGCTLRVADAEAAAFLADRSAALLPLDREAHATRQMLGLTTIGSFATLPRHAIEAQFGVAGGLAWLAARGADPSPVRPRFVPEEQVEERVQAEPPLISREAILRTVEQLLGRAMRQQRAHQRFVRVLRLRVVTEDGRLWQRVQALKEPTGDRERLWVTLRTLLEVADFGGPVAELSLSLGGLTAESGRQGGLFQDRARRREELDQMVRHLKVRYGQSPIARVVAVEPWSRIPERRHALIDYDP